MPLQTCPSCGKVFEQNYGNSPVPLNCPECGARLAQNARMAMHPAAPNVGLAAFPVTATLIGLNALVFAVMVLRGVSALNPSPQQAIAFGADFGPLTLNGQWWRLVTSMFVHFGIVHIGLNMWCLWNLGRAAEQLMGRFAYVLAYFVSGIFASIASVYWHPMAAGAGASGAIFGMAGVLVSYVYLKKTPSHLQINSRMLGSLGTFIAYNLAFGALPGISNAAHIGGLVMGLAFGALLPASSAPESARRSRLSLVVAFSVIALVGSAIAAKKLAAGVSDLSSIQHLLATGKSDEALAQLQQLTAHEPDLAPGQELLAKVYLSKSKYPEAIAAMQKAYEADPENVTYHKELGGIYFQLGELDEALAFFQKLTQQNPKEAFAHLGLGQAFFSKRNYESAIPEFRAALTLDPQMRSAAYMLGQSQLQAGHFSDAQRTYRDILAHHPDDTRAKAGLEFATRPAH
jgi:membrane associated rhomboid family serine protease/Flp pilus assembly protein TadD